MKYSPKIPSEGSDIRIAKKMDHFLRKERNDKPQKERIETEKILLIKKIQYCRKQISRIKNWRIKSGLMGRRGWEIIRMEGDDVDVAIGSNYK
jgi:hypothetical protein